MNGIEFRRKKENITQSQLAERLGVSQANISQWENGEAFPRADKLPALAEALNCTIDDLFENNSA
ncbi:MAG: helix-turn-helix transcriptional regulator [Clostridia bacterium]|nr:helix-turn-helix transcriptional regulator [Clostridia bacterium]